MPNMANSSPLHVDVEAPHHWIRFTTSGELPSALVKEKPIASAPVEKPPTHGSIVGMLNGMAALGMVAGVWA